MNIVTLSIEDITPYEKNTRKHTDFDVANIAKSIEKYGFNDPIGVWGKRNIVVEGHGRLLAAKRLGMTEVPCVRLDHLTDKERREYGIAHNATAELSAWDVDSLLEELPDLDLLDFDFDFDLEPVAVTDAEFEENMRTGKERLTSNSEYEKFTEKFELAKTTDDCFTPPEVYAEVLKWVTNEYGLQGRQIVRPFYPGGDYENEDYPAGCVVLDNPPFSILTQIILFYKSRGIDFFLFAPSLTLFSAPTAEVQYIAAGCQVVYENGAIVNTGFVTNLDASLMRTAPELYSAVKKAQEEAKKEKKAELPKYTYPANLITSAMLNSLSQRGQKWSTNSGHFIRKLDTQEGTIYGGGYLVGDRAAREAEAARREAEAARREAEAARRESAEGKKYIFALSEREKAIVAELTEREKREEKTSK